MGGVGDIEAGGMDGMGGLATWLGATLFEGRRHQLPQRW